MNMTASRLLPVGIALALIGPAATGRNATQRPLTIERPWSRATSPRAEVGAGFLTIRNKGRSADRLLGATSPQASRVEIHTMTMGGGVMRMRPVTAGLVVDPGARVALQPGSYHLMLIGLKKPLREGELVPVTLRFEHVGAVSIRLRVEGPGASQSMGRE